MNTPRRIRWQRIAAYTGSAIFGLVLLAAVVAQLRYGVLLREPRADRSEFTAGAGVYGTVDPREIRPLITELLDGELGQAPPPWLVESALPYSAAAAARLNFDEGAIDLTFYLNPRRLLPAIERRTNRVDWPKIAPEITWHNPAVNRTQPGVLALLGSVPMEPEAEQAFWYTWNQSFNPPPLTLEGGHFVEVIMDNRTGQAYLAAASLLLAYDIDLDAQEQDISLSSLQFVEVGRMTLDFKPPDRFALRLRLDIQPDAIERLGVVNLKVAIQDGFAELGERWRRHGIEFSGESRWEDTAIVYEYDLKPAVTVLEAAIDGELF